MHSHSSITSTNASNQRGISLTAERYKHAEQETNSYHVDNVHWNVNWYVPIKPDKEIITVKSDGKEQDNYHEVNCKGSGYIDKYTFKSQMQVVNLTYDTESGQILDPNNRPLPCKYKDGGCDSTGFEKYAYFWEPKDSCVLGKIKHAKARMIKWKGKDRYFIMRMGADLRTNPKTGKRSEKQEVNYKFEVFRGQELYVKTQASDYIKLTSTHYIYVSWAVVTT